MRIDAEPSAGPLRPFEPRQTSRLPPVKWSVRMRSLAAFWFFACVTMAFVPFGCASNIESLPLKQAPIIEGPHAPNRTVARLRECVEEYGGDLGGRGFEFHYDVEIDKEGRAASVKSDGFHADFDGCTRAALRSMELPLELLKTWISEPLARRDGQTNAARGLVGNLVIVGVSIVLAPIMIEAAGLTILFTITLVLAGEVIDAIQKYRPPPNLNRCLDAAAGGKYMWEEFCRAVAEKLPDPYDASQCWGRTSKSEQNKRNWCRNLFGN